MKSFLSQVASACILLAALSGCAETSAWMDGMPAWLGGSSVPHQTISQQSLKDIAPPPAAAPVTPVVAETALPMLQSKVKVGVLLPLTGPNAGLGHAMLNAAQEAAYDAGAANFELMPRDTGSTEMAATNAAREVISAGAQLLVGPLFAAQVPAVFRVAQPAGIPVLTLSTDTSLASPGLYVMGFAPGPQATRAVQFASQHGARRFAAIVPNNNYGSVVGQAFHLAVASEGAAVVAFATYDPTQRNSEIQIHELADKVGVIDALFLPEGGSDLMTITKQLTAVGFDAKKIRVLGTGLWDTPETGKQAEFVQGGWYAASDPAVRQGFLSAYKSTYNEDAPRLATLAYDATALAAALAKRGAKFDQATLTSKNGFAGLDGIFRLKRNGEVERGLAILKITPDGSEVIDSAPISFVTP